MHLKTNKTPQKILIKPMQVLHVNIIIIQAKNHTWVLQKKKLDITKKPFFLSLAMGEKEGRV
jgi:hypothetical protein